MASVFADEASHHLFLNFYPNVFSDNSCAEDSKLNSF
jgi:hypothetical protein